MRARTRLKALMARVKVGEFETEQIGEFDASEMFKAVEPHITADSFDGVHIYPAPAGGWHADITLKGLPPGLPPVLGTPVSMPCLTRGEAERTAERMLALFVRRISERDRSEDAVRSQRVPFEYDDVGVFVPREFLDAIAKKAGTPPEGLAKRRLAEIRAELTDRATIDEDVVRGFSPEQMGRFQTVLAIALLSGINRWPEPAPMPPAG